MIDLIDQCRADLEALCRKYHVRTLELFGSAVAGTWQSERSDLDFLVEFQPDAAERMFHGYFDFRDELAQLFGRKVDLVMAAAIHNPYFRKAVDQHRMVLYAA